MSSKQRLSASITIGSVIEQSVKKNIGVLRSGLQSVGNEIKTVEKRQRELSKQRNVLVRQGQSVEALDRDYEELNRTLVKLRRSQERWTRAAGASRRVGSSFSSMAGEIGRSARTISFGLGLAGGAIFGLASSTAQLGDDVAKTADKLGIGTAALQELRYAAERSGVATATFDGSLEKMVKNIGLAMDGTGAQKDAFDALGLSASDLATMLPEDALALIADRMQGVATQSEKAALANDIFGRSGLGLLVMLRDGSKGLEKLRNDARRTGYVLSEQAARDAEVFQDTLLDTQLAAKGLKNTVGAALLPVVTGALAQIGDALIANHANIEVWAEAFAGGVERSLPNIIELGKGLGKVLGVTQSVMAATADMVGGWENFGIIIGGVLGSRLIVKVGKFAGAVFGLGRALWVLTGATPFVVGGIRAIGLALVANPIGATIAVIAAGAALIISNWETLGPWFSDMWGVVLEKFDAIATFVGGAFTSTMDAAGSAMKSTWGAVKGFLDPILTWIGDKFTTVLGVIQPVIDALKWTVDNAQGALAAIGVGDNRPTVDVGAAAQESAGQTGAIVGGAVSPKTQARLDANKARLAKRQNLQTNALGGPFGSGWHLTGERGPELKFENRAGYVANNRALRQAVTMSDRLAGNSPMAARLSGMGGRSGARSGGAPNQGVTQSITNHFHAAGVSASELLELAERKMRKQAQGGLYDRAPSSGPFGR
ncbi:hypothetical protein AB9F29_16595 [Falsihalocynthiibacter sp. S25ZX9]|uniref:hypothetical protein n=1 Tax=Falsihalocynthiibacter sp. S25ZX9 TaxID=3240870 RepID=UPI00350FF759